MRLILTLDYELYGNGEGDVVKHIIEPTRRFIEICNSYNVKATIFFEVMEYLKIKEMYESGVSMGYDENPAILIEKQIIAVHEEGHDIQLHVHPQWVGAKYRNGTWKINPKYWPLGNVPLHESEDCETGLKDLLKMGKSAIENIINRVDPSYRCEILRAGGLNIYPSENILAAMRLAGLKADSSVVPGASRNSEYAFYDFRKISNDIPYWRTHTDNLLDVNDESSGKTPIYEFPIFAIEDYKYKKLTPARLLKKLGNKSGIKTTVNMVRNKSGIGKIEFIKGLFQKEMLMWDFCLLPCSRMKRYCSIAKAIQKNARHPFVLIGHSKEFTQTNSLVKFFRYVADKNDIDCEFTTLGNLLPEVAVK